MVGNLAEWTDTIVDGQVPIMSGGFTALGETFNAASPQTYRAATHSTRFLGFRVAEELSVNTYVYGVDNNGVIWQINPAAKTSSPVRKTTLTTAPNALAFDPARQHLFVFDGAVPGDMYLWNIPANTFTKITINAAVIDLTEVPAGAAYYNNAVWFFYPKATSYTGVRNSRELIKIPLTYGASVTAGQPQIIQTNVQTSIDNRFGDFAINPNTGLLYASTNTGYMYTLNVNTPNASFTLLKSGMAGMQVSFNAAYNLVYLHNIIAGQWYTHDITTNTITTLDLVTTITPSNSNSVGFRDLCGPNTAALPVITLP
jgi:hypothetical protein